ncbi:Uncharacterised protein [Chlamydia trachomatis]|nr:Uncharacterised protein [Chlamydia trachomatis]
MVLFGYEVGSIALESLKNLLLILLWVDEALLSRADDPIIKGSTLDDDLGGFIKVIDVFINNNLYVSSTNTE